ncbi:MAG: DUF4288 domain-containing protein, partial [Myxococcota bacterium]
MNWYSGKFIFKSDVENDSEPLVEESIRVFRASDDQAAETRAQELGTASEHSYENENGQTVTWRFIEVQEIQDLCETELEDGTEVYS